MLDKAILCGVHTTQVVLGGGWRPRSPGLGHNELANRQTRHKKRRGEREDTALCVCLGCEVSSKVVRTSKHESIDNMHYE